MLRSGSFTEIENGNTRINRWIIPGRIWLAVSEKGSNRMESIGFIRQARNAGRKPATEAINKQIMIAIQKIDKSQ
jgi:hypothetical protein